MRGKRAKILRKIAYQNPVMKYSRNREYESVVSPGQHRHKMPLTIITDNERYMYQALKGRRGDLSGTDLG